ncbi:hypothetical protein N5J44_06185 [Acinetobacter ursingii]|uniref:hypothetical protein n=1 Tax=Acinetobacter ursingii TaxID=108980 RepID=UPI00244A19B7|nr:hypothetical protein [Acinetobacter ursingii]MDH2018888.1 hypothetical protein [Acinetobacter ursingii]MDH2071139.1 hypothetical protein [Acinetobacter ursingii]
MKKLKLSLILSIGLLSGFPIMAQAKPTICQIDEGGGGSIWDNAVRSKTQKSPLVR